MDQTIAANLAHRPPIDIAQTSVGPELEAIEGTLDTLQEIPVTDHVAIFDTIHRQLSDLLASVDDA